MIPAIFGLSGPELTSEEQAFFRDCDPAGYILFGRNCRNPAQLRALTDALRDLSGRADLPILIDQEGGRVARLGPPHWPDAPAPWRFAELYRRAPISAIEAARLNACAVGTILRQAGVTVNCFPLLDLRHGSGHPAIGDRALGTEPMQVAALGRAALEGLARCGVAGVIKHLPGQGRAAADSHVALPVVEADEETLEADLEPFRALRHAPIAMTGHVLYTAWDRERCATLSPVIIGEVIRGRIGFEGLLISDDLRMGALQGSPAERARGALAAGCDLILHGSPDRSDRAGIAAGVEPIAPSAAERLAQAMRGSGEAGDAPDLAPILAKRDALLALA